MSKILYYPQISMYDKQTKELLPQADGNVNMMRNTILEWQKHRPDDEFYILLPSELKNKLSQILPDGTLNCYPMFYNGFVVSARINRFNFPMNEFSSILKNHKIDLIINDVIELTGNFKQLFKIEFGYEPKIISNIRHLDDNINNSYMFRVTDGIIQSDLVTILSDSMLNKLDDQIYEIMPYPLYNSVIDKIISFEPSISQTEINKYLRNAVIKDLNKITITFPGRLSIGEERRTNWDKFILAILKLRKERQDFEVYFTDPNNSISDELVEQDSWIKTIPKDRSQFLNLLNKTDIIVSLMDVEGFGGISIREALLFGCRPVIPYVHEYKKMSPNIDYPGFIVSSPIRVDELVNALNKSIDFGHKNFHTDNWSNIGKQFSIEEQFKKLIPKIEVLLNA